MIKIFKKIVNAIRRLFGWKDKKKEVEVPQGLQVWDENGSVVMDTTTKISTIVDRVYITGGSGSFTVVNDLFVSGTPFAITNAHPALDNSPILFFEKLTTNKLTVTYHGALYNSANPSYFAIGVY